VDLDKLLAKWDDYIVKMKKEILGEEEEE